MSRYVIGDIHGNYKALKQCLERSTFDKEKDTLISLGDICDGNYETKECMDELLSIKNLILVKSNHDLWLLGWFMSGAEPSIWTNQGGRATLASYDYDRTKVHPSHIRLLKDAVPYYVDDKNILYVHGGFDPSINIEDNPINTLIWDRKLISTAMLAHGANPSYKFSKFSEIILGHTETPTGKPLHFCNVWNIDTGAGWNGYLTIMNTETKQWWQSDSAITLYGRIKG